MKIELSTRIEAPPDVVYSFYVQLDHLRYVSARRRAEWCLEPGRRLETGHDYVVRVEQSGHGLDLHFKARRLDPGHGYELEFTTWPLRGALHVQTLEGLDGDAATRVTTVDQWHPPWYVRRVLERMVEGQRILFEEKLRNAKRVIEAVYRVRGREAFAGGIRDDARIAGIEPTVSSASG